MSQRQSSIFSLASLGLTSKQDELCYEDMTKKELYRALENIARTNLLLKLENDVFEQYLLRRDPESLQKIAQISETAKRVQKLAPQHSPRSSVMSVTGSLTTIRDKDSMSVISVQTGSLQVTPSVLTTKGMKGGVKITYAHRIEMVQNEIREMLKKLAVLEHTSIKKTMYLRAKMEENEIGIRETRESKEKFEKDVVQMGVDSITGKIPAEKFIKFTEDWLKATDAIIGRLRLKAITVKSQINRVKMQLKQRKERGEALRAVDFEQLNIENQDCIRKIDEKFQYLLEMKRIAGRYSIAMTKHKEKLRDLMFGMNEVKSKIASKKQTAMKLESEEIDMTDKVKKSEKQLKSLITLTENFSVPDVMDFVRVNAELQKAQKIHKKLHRQRKIQSLTFRSIS